MAFCYSIVMVPNKRSLHQASGSGLELGTCIVSNRYDHWSSDCLKLFRTSFHVVEKLCCHTSVLYIGHLWCLSYLLVREVRFTRLKVIPWGKTGDMTCIQLSSASHDSWAFSLSLSTVPDISPRDLRVRPYSATELRVTWVVSHCLLRPLLEGWRYMSV